MYHALVWSIQVKDAGIKSETIKTMTGSFLANPGKYLPGKVWTVIGRAYWLSKEGNAISECSSIAVLSQVTSLAASIIVVLILTPFFLFEKKIPSIYSSFFILFFLLCLLHPKIFFKTINYLLRVFKKHEIKIYLNLNTLLSWIGLNIVTGILSGIAFFLFILLIANIPFADLHFLIAVYTLAGVLGFLSFFSPGGLGVREGVLTVLLSPYIGMETAIISSIGFRLLLVFSELFCAGIAWIILQQKNSVKSSTGNPSS